jgi:hypothetical protein
MHSRKPAKDPDNYDDSEVLRMLRNSNINDSGLSSTSRQPDNDIDGKLFHLKFSMCTLQFMYAQIFFYPPAKTG